MLRPSTIESVNRMNTETMLFKIDIFYLPVSRACIKIDRSAADADITTSSASLENYKAAQEEGCWPDPGCRNVISKGSYRLITLEGGKVCALTHIRFASEVIEQSWRRSVPKRGSVR